MPDSPNPLAPTTIPGHLKALANAVIGGERAAIARALNMVEDRRVEVRAEAAPFLGELERRGVPGAGHRIGLTGPPGVGKSTLAAALARQLRFRDRRVGVVAVDPSSLRSRGSLLGDRARMTFGADDDGLFMRSLATGGDPGGLSDPAHAAVTVLAAAFSTVLVETTGVGQTETDVEQLTDTVVLVIQPGSGDALQFLKAGIMEIPDIVVVNKADHRALADRAVADLQGAALSRAGAGAGPQLPILATSAVKDEGIGALVDAFDRHREGLGAAGVQARRERGAEQWTAGLFRRAYGSFGARTLRAHGHDPAALIRQARAQGLSPPEILGRLGAQVVRCVRAT